MFVTAVGDDLFGIGSRENFKKVNIDDSHVMTIPKTGNGVASIIVEESGQNRILVHAGANDAFTPERLSDAAEDLADCALIVLQLEIPLETVYAAIDFGRAHGIPVILNPAPAVRSLAIDKVCACEFFMPNESELSLITGMPTGTFEEVCAAAKTLLAQGLKNVIVTLGSRGAVWLSGDAATIVEARKVKAVDTTGAGDAFIGCFAAGYVKDGDIKAAMEKASRYATLSVTKQGTQDSYATKEEFLDYLKNNP